MIIYTANYGDKDEVKEPPVCASWNKDLKFVYFTDRQFESNVWDVVVDVKHGNSTRIAKWYKINSHELFPGEATLWVDASIHIRSDPTKFFQGWDNMIVREHHKRCDIYEEAKACIQSSRGDPVAIAEQAAEYKRQEFPKGSGLYINGILFRKPTDATTGLNKAWWQQIERHSARDQISLPYVLHTQGTLVKKVGYRHFGWNFSKAETHKFRGTKEI